MEFANKKRDTKKTTSTQFQVLVSELEANIELARGAPVFGANKDAFDEKWNAIADKVNSHGPPQRSAGEWRKIFADLKCRTKKKIADNADSISATGGGPFRQTPLTEVEEAIDRILLMVKGAAPKGVTLGASRSSGMTSTVNVVGMSAAAHSTPPLPSTPPIPPTPPSLGQVAPPNNAGENALNAIPQSPPANDVSMNSVSMNSVVTPSRGRRRALPNRTFQHRIADSARIQADAAKAQAKATESIAQSLKQLVQFSARHTEALEAIVANTTTEFVCNSFADAELKPVDENN